MQTGSCLCRAVKFEVAGDLAPIQLCHCGDCRKAQGSAFAANILVATADFRLLVTAALQSIAAVVRHGALEHLEFARCTLSASLTLARLDEPLWQSEKVELDGLRLAVRPPWVILPAVAPSVQVPTPRRPR